LTEFSELRRKKRDCKDSMQNQQIRKSKQKYKCRRYLSVKVETKPQKEKFSEENYKNKRRKREIVSKNRKNTENINRISIFENNKFYELPRKIYSFGYF
jgi:predicted methyltransferase